MAHTSTPSRTRWFSSPWVYAIALALLGGSLAAMSRERWVPALQDRLGLNAVKPGNQSTKEQAESGHDHSGHDHSHAGHEEGNSIELSEQARKNIGLQTAKVELKPFTRTISVPGLVVERPGRSIFRISAPLTGVITAIYPTEGEAVEPGQKLFDIRLTHEELVQLQADLLRTAEELDVVGREIARIEKLTKEGGLPGKTLLERQYEQQKQQAVLRSQRQALILHGLSTIQVDEILEKRTLLQTLSVNVPSPTNKTDPPRYFQVLDLDVAQGEHVNAGDTMAVLVDHSELFVEGNAFERDVEEISRASAEDKPISVLLELEGQESQTVPNLKILYVSPKIEPESRTLHFYATLPNLLAQNKVLDDGRRYITWRFRPGQRTQLQVPVETWNDQIVLPAEAVVEEGAEAYVFTPNGDHFDRRTVHIEHKDQSSVVVANDGVLFPGDLVAITAAKQLQLALKNKSGGGIDPHAGHNH